ncbi:hypothetical protein FH972_021783 [Carpinus fangiana]|uniref:PHD-type domain-containing protein n=1 Tax=Carpinus fangiana TaxID=176857 RepID=A0A5N6KQX0_9ROSI|nr:hypothetical protein FH972_021783 [Carpinus fangiana]
MADYPSDAPATAHAASDPRAGGLNGPRLGAPSEHVPAANTIAFTANAVAPPKPLPQIEGLSESTQALLKRVGQAHSFSTGSPEWEKAREETGSEVSVSYTPQATITKSGRNVTKPSQFVPPVPEMSPSSGQKRRRTYQRKNPEITQLCAKCSRGHSPASNMVVFCDGCNLAYHQWCHDPHIPREVVEIAEKEWFCSRCQSQRELEHLPIDQRVSGQSLTEEERKQHLSRLAHTTLVRLLLRATALHPDLPIYAPNAREALRSTSSPLSPIPNHADGPVRNNDPYPDYSNPDNDPPATYPRPGTGPIPLQPTTDPERIQWLVDDNFDVYSHSYDDGSGEGLKPVDRSKGDSWIQHTNDTLKKETTHDTTGAFTNGQHANPGHDVPQTRPPVQDRHVFDAIGDESDEVRIDQPGEVGDLDMGMFDSSMP